jgi:phage baseplate assembly protein W
MIGLNKTNGQTISSINQHVQQSVGDIVTTPIGTRVMRRTYGSVIPDLIDHPINAKNIMRIYAATAAAIMLWEPRFKVIQISFLHLKTAQVSIEITGSIDNQNDTINIPLYTPIERIVLKPSQRFSRWFNGIDQATTIPFKIGDTVLLYVYALGGNKGLPQGCPPIDNAQFERVEFIALNAGKIGQSNGEFFLGSIINCQINQQHYPFNDEYRLLRDAQGNKAAEYINEPTSLILDKQDNGSWFSQEKNLNYPLSPLLLAINKHGFDNLKISSNTFHQLIHQGD